MAGADPREARAATDLRQFARLAIQLFLILSVFRAFQIEEPAFFLISATLFIGFAVHYWLPFRFKEWFFVALSVGGAFLILDAKVLGGLLACGAVIYGIIRSPLAWGWRAALVAAVFAVLIYGRTAEGLGIHTSFWPLFGALFMFRILVYLYDVKHQKGRPSLREFLSYFFLLPNFYFLLFPVIDFQTMRRSFFQKDIHETAQQGIEWMFRGTIQLLLYRVVDHLRGEPLASEVSSLPRLVLLMVLTYMLYLRVSGHFHIIVGMLHLFGYNLPETNRKYFLASSLTDFWRRINIYWKDFMVKLVYFPIYFQLRKSGDRRAQIAATSGVFLVTWFLHSYQVFWLKGYWLFSWPDLLFWMVLGTLVILNLLLEMKAQARGHRAGRVHPVQRGLKIAGTFSLLVFLWFFWNSRSIEEWLEVMTWWTK